MSKGVLQSIFTKSVQIEEIINELSKCKFAVNYVINHEKYKEISLFKNASYYENIIISNVKQFTKIVELVDANIITYQDMVKIIIDYIDFIGLILYSKEEPSTLIHTLNAISYGRKEFVNSLSTRVDNIIKMTISIIREGVESEIQVIKPIIHFDTIKRDTLTMIFNQVYEISKLIYGPLLGIQIMTALYCKFKYEVPMHPTKVINSAKKYISYDISTKLVTNSNIIDNIIMAYENNFNIVETVYERLIYATESNIDEVPETSIAIINSAMDNFINKYPEISFLLAGVFANSIEYIKCDIVEEFLKCITEKEKKFITDKKIDKQILINIIKIIYKFSDIDSTKYCRYIESTLFVERIMRAVTIY